MHDFESNRYIDWTIEAEKASSCPYIVYNKEYHLKMNQIGTSLHHLSHTPTKKEKSDSTVAVFVKAEASPPYNNANIAKCPLVKDHACVKLVLRLLPYTLHP